MESELLVKERQLVIPGETIAKGLDFLPSSGAYRLDGEIKSKLLGIVRTKERFIGVTPLEGVYIPRPGDKIIGTVEDMQSTFWIVDLNSPYDAILPLSEGVGEFVDLAKTDISIYYDIGDIVYAKVLNVSKTKSVSLTMNDYRAKKLSGGRLLTVSSSKVPRIIGKEGSMIELIKSKTECNIVIGQNGIVWLKGGKEGLAAKAILMIEREYRASGLTDKVSELLNKGE